MYTWTIYIFLSQRIMLPYAMVGKRRTPDASSVVLAEFAFDPSQPFGTWARECLEKPKQGDAMNEVEGFAMLVLDREGMVFQVAAKHEAQRAGNEALQVLASSFAARIGMARARGATRRYAFNAEFAPAIQRHLEKFSKQGELDQGLAELEADLENAKGKAQQTVIKMVERGGMIDSLSNTAGKLAGTSQAFKNNATHMSRMEVWKKWKYQIILMGVFSLVMLFMYYLVKS